MITHKIVCNGCGRVGDESKGPHRRPPREMRQMLTELRGWKTAIIQDGTGGWDYCFTCVKEGKHK
jgi:hypothetical protein